MNPWQPPPKTVIISRDNRDIILYLFKVKDEQNAQTDSKNLCNQSPKTLFKKRDRRADGGDRQTNHY